MTAPPDSNGRKVTSLRELPQSIAPARELWPGIEAQLGEIPAERSCQFTSTARRSRRSLRARCNCALHVPSAMPSICAASPWE